VIWLVHKVLHDVSVKAASSGAPDFIQISTKYHKAAKSAEKKNLLLPILASSTAVVHDDWLAT
jgi:NADPH-dependent 7-cyano-7-deazaguanine reductase QueF